VMPGVMPLCPVSHMDLRTARAEDYDFLYRLRRAAMKDYVARTWGWDENWQEEHFRRQFDPSVNQIITSQGRDVGVLSVSESDAEVFLRYIEVLPEFQRRGIGTIIIRAILEGAERKGKSVVLRVLKVNPARSLYECLGFSVVGETPTHYLMKWAPADAA
jgi:ribosomal protein S18 acetylase RimI-like enzyme